MKLKSHNYFTIFVMLIMAFAVWEATHWPLKASIMILVLGSGGVLVTGIQLVRELRNPGKTESSGMDIEVDEELTGKKTTPRIVAISAWIVGLFVSIWMIGFFIAVPLFSFLYSKFNGARWAIAILIAAINTLTLWGLFEQLLHVPWPEPVLQRFLPFLPG